MMQYKEYIFRGFPDGLDYCIKRSTKQNRRVAQHTGFGDAVVALSNARGGKILTASLNPAYKQLKKLMIESVLVEQNPTKWNFYVGQSYDNESLERNSGMIVTPNYVTDDYLSLNPNKFAQVSVPDSYITTQTVGASKKARIDNTEKLKKFIKSFGLPVIDLNEAKRYNLNELAYIVNNAKYHVAIDSGTTHFALTIKPKDDVVICLNKDRLTGVGKKWIEKSYNYEFI